MVIRRYRRGFHAQDFSRTQYWKLLQKTLGVFMGSIKPPLISGSRSTTEKT